MDSITAPPEVTSALIYSGPGAGSLIEASNGWQQLGTELEHAATSYTSVLSSLTAAWRGPSSMAMSQAVEPYLTWMRTTAQQCLQAGSSAQAAAAAFTSARSAIVPPSQVSANRTRLAQLIATNQFGINLPAIAETEAQYQGMWVNNSAAMSRYAATSAQATALPQFSSPPPVANPAGLAAQASAVPAATSADPPASTATSILSALADFDPTTGWSGLATTWGT
ncbi:MAG TPA: PPE family protein, partial [Mycobacterium sp.]|nr:PPE family protein [Mycobacterium sp.]